MNTSPDINRFESSVDLDQLALSSVDLDQLALSSIDLDQLASQKPADHDPLCVNSSSNITGIM